MDETQPSDCYSAGNVTAAKIGKLFAYCLIIVVSLTGNSLIGIIIYKKKPMRKKINYFILNMSMSDILISIFIISVHFVELLDKVKLSRAKCKVAPIVKYLMILRCVCWEPGSECSRSIWSFAVFPLRRPFISSNIYPFLILATWISGVVVVSPYLTAFHLLKHEGKWTCALPFTEIFLKKKHIQASSLIFFSLSFALIFRPILRVHYTFSVTRKWAFLLCVKRESGFIFSVIRNLYFSVIGKLVFVIREICINLRVICKLTIFAGVHFNFLELRDVKPAYSTHSDSKGKTKTGLHGLPMCFCGCVALWKSSNYSFALTSMSFRDFPLL